MKVVRSLHEVERLSSNPNDCVSDLCLPFKPNIQNIIILPPVLRMHSSGTHCTVIRSSLHRKQLFRFIWIIIHLPWLHFPRIVGGDSETGTNFSFLAALWYLRWIGMLIFTFMDPSLCTKNENNNNCRCPLYISGYSYSSKNTFCVYYIIVLLYFTKGRGDLAPSPSPWGVLVVSFTVRIFFTFRIRLFYPRFFKNNNNTRIYIAPFPWAQWH